VKLTTLITFGQNPLAKWSKIPIFSKHSDEGNAVLRR